ncbi:MAG: bifunctional glutamate N-acetyltransferase/amino-acid acetyltransferase ArgJ [Alphaproteobacteria bacterium]
MAKKSLPPSPLAPESMAELPPLAGVRLAAGSAGLRYSGRPDLTLAVFDPGTTVGGVFTRSLTCGVPIDWNRARIGGGQAGALVVNAGNANVMNGEIGKTTARATAEAAAQVAGCAVDQVFLASTGVIGEPFYPDKIVAGVHKLGAELSADAFQTAAQAIMTTDTFAKRATRRVEIDGKPVTINGIAKGSGMIAPNMATMLAYIFTDAAVAPAALQQMTTFCAERSFNCVTVDGDTSTSDMCLVFATGKAGNRPVQASRERRARAFFLALRDVMVELAQLVARDGEGAQKFITVTVTGAASRQAARRIALSIGNSPLVKTAIAGSDANWGRIAMAVGKSGEKASREGLDIRIGGVPIAEDGGIVAGYDEAPVAAHLAGREIDIEVDVGVGRGMATIWTCDLTHGYIDINADYRS